LRDRLLGSAWVAAMVTLTALSRVYLGAHYPSDVAAAAAEGVTWLVLWFTVFDRTSAAHRGSGNA
jgi:undecaprenyl-diphosphatase